MVKTIKYNSREEMITAIRHTMQRKREWIERADREFAAIRQRQQSTAQ